MSDCYECDGSGWSRKSAEDDVGSACLTCRRPECPFCLTQMAVEESHTAPPLVYWACGCTKETMNQILKRQ